MKTISLTPQKQLILPLITLLIVYFSFINQLHKSDYTYLQIYTILFFAAVLFYIQLFISDDTKAEISKASQYSGYFLHSLLLLFSAWTIYDHNVYILRLEKYYLITGFILVFLSALSWFIKDRDKTQFLLNALCLVVFLITAIPNIYPQGPFTPIRFFDSETTVHEIINQFNEKKKTLNSNELRQYVEEVKSSNFCPLTLFYYKIIFTEDGKNIRVYSKSDRIAFVSDNSFITLSQMKEDRHNGSFIPTKYYYYFVLLLILEFAWGLYLSILLCLNRKITVIILASLTIVLIVTAYLVRPEASPSYESYLFLDIGIVLLTIASLPLLKNEAFINKVFIQERKF